MKILKLNELSKLNENSRETFSPNFFDDIIKHGTIDVYLSKYDKSYTLKVIDLINYIKNIN